MNAALILAGGSGTRLGAHIPKQYIEVNGKPIIAYCLETFFSHEKVDFVWIAAEEYWHEFIRQSFPKQWEKKFCGFSKPGETRQLSILNGLRAMKDSVDSDDVVIVHDAARACLSKKLLTECLLAVEGHDGVMPVLPMKDTVYYSENGTSIASLLKREKIFAGQAPELFRFGKYLAANEALLPQKILVVNGSSEPAVLAGLDIAMVAGEEENFKITTKEDLKRFERILASFNDEV